MMGTELVPETSIFNQLSRLIAREDFINEGKVVENHVIPISIVGIFTRDE
jgi:hypothetical protein